MSDLEHVKAFLLLVKNYHRLSASFDKSWFQLVYSTDFIDTVDNDAHLNAIGHAISEVLIFNKTLTWHSLNASRLLELLGRLENEKQLDNEDVVYFVGQARRIRDDIDTTLEILQKFAGELNRELEALFVKTGITYEKVKR
jgi:hypothetical protein